MSLLQTSRSVGDKILLGLCIFRNATLELCGIAELLEHGFDNGDFDAGDRVGDPVGRG